MRLSYTPRSLRTVSQLPRLMIYGLSIQVPRETRQIREQDRSCFKAQSIFETLQSSCAERERLMWELIGMLYVSPLVLVCEIKYWRIALSVLDRQKISMPPPMYIFAYCCSASLEDEQTDICSVTSPVSSFTVVRVCTFFLKKTPPNQNQFLQLFCALNGVVNFTLVVPTTILQQSPLWYYGSPDYLIHFLTSELPVRKTPDFRV